MKATKSRKPARVQKVQKVQKPQKTEKVNKVQKVKKTQTAAKPAKATPKTTKTSRTPKAAKSLKSPKSPKNQNVQKAITKTAPVARKTNWLARRDPIQIIEQSNEGRIEGLVPIRHSRMSVSPFTFFRGTASVMAADLAVESNSGIIVQCCGDCHILNFGAFATPERNIIIDMNDFDETHPAPFEWDVKRLASSFILAIETAGLGKGTGETAVLEMIRSYQKSMAEHAKQRLLDVWYAKIDHQAFVDQTINRSLRKKRSKDLTKEILKSNPETLETKLIERRNGEWQFKEMPPLLYHAADKNLNQTKRSYEDYLNSLSGDRRLLLSHFELRDIAVKVVGTGSVGTFCAVVLLIGPNDGPLILQVKEARQSVLEPYTQKSKFAHEGERIVVGQRIMQSASDMFLGWTTGINGRDFYIRQLRDVKLSPNPETWTKKSVPDSARFAGCVLAKAHAKSGSSAAISEYIGKSDKFAKEIAKYALKYAELTRSDYREFIDACRSGRLATEKSLGV